MPQSTKKEIRANAKKKNNKAFGKNKTPALGGNGWSHYTKGQAASGEREGGRGMMISKIPHPHHVMEWGLSVSMFSFFSLHNATHACLNCLDIILVFVFFCLPGFLACVMAAIPKASFFHEVAEQLCIDHRIERNPAVGPGLGIKHY